MSYNVKPKFKSAYSRPPSVSPSCYFSASSSSPHFCDNPVHDPLFECCCDEDTKCINPKVFQKRKLKKRKSAPKNPSPRTTPQDPDKEITKEIISIPTNRSSSSFKLPNNLFLNLDDLDIKSTARNNPTITRRTITGRTNRPGFSYEKDCSIIQTNRSNNFRTLCDKFESTCITPRFLKLYSKVPDHDKKILNRMAVKRIKDSVLAEDTVIAHKYWIEEKAERDQLLNVQNKMYSKVLRSRREREQQEMEDRLAFLEERDKVQRERLKKEIEEKYVKVSGRLKNLKLARDLHLCDRKQNDLKKLDAVVANSYGNELEKELKRQESINRLEEKISQAESLKKRLINSYRSRIHADNEVARYKHAANFEEMQKVEMFKQNRLKQDLMNRDRKFNKFVERKTRLLDASVNQAKTSAILRDMIRNSCTPENLSFRFMNQQLQSRMGGATSNLSQYNVMRLSKM